MLVGVVLSGGACSIRVQTLVCSIERVRGMDFRRRGVIRRCTLYSYSIVSFLTRKVDGNRGSQASCYQPGPALLVFNCLFADSKGCGRWMSRREGGAPVRNVTMKIRKGIKGKGGEQARKRRREARERGMMVENELRKQGTGGETRNRGLASAWGGARQGAWLWDVAGTKEGGRWTG